MGDRVPLEASRLNPKAGLEGHEAVPSTHAEATILIRRRADARAGDRVERILRGEAPAMPLEAAEESLGADPEDLRRVADFAASEGLSVIEASAARRSVRVAGTLAQMESAFQVHLLSAASNGQEYLYYEGTLSIPSALAGIIVGVLGLDQRPIATRPKGAPDGS
jgi:kumamolisin